MSADNVGTHFVDDLVNMALTAKRVPELEATIRNLQTADELNAHTIVELNKQIIDHVNAKVELANKLATAEASRDDAEFRFLEADDAKGTAVRTLQDMVRQAQALIAAVTPPEPEPVKPDYTGKWLTDVPGWGHISLEQWTDNGGTADHFTVVKPLVPFAVSTPVGEGSATANPSAPQDAAPSTGPHGEGYTGQSESGESTAPSPMTAPSASEIVSSALAEHGEDVHSSTANAEVDSVSPHPTVETLRGSPSMIAQSQHVDGSTSVPVIESPEVAHTGPFAHSTDSASTSAPTGDVGTKESASSHNPVQPKATEGGEAELWPTGFASASRYL